MLKLIKDGYVKNTKFAVLDTFHNFSSSFLVFHFFFSWKVINLSTQLSYFKNMKRQLGLQLGEAEAQKLLSTAVYMFSIGGNDYFEALTPMHSLLQFYSREEYVGMVIGNITTVIQVI